MFKSIAFTFASRALAIVQPLVVYGILFGCVQFSRGESVTLDATRNTTIFSDATSNSAGSGPIMYVGDDNTSAPRRGLVEFNLSGAVPAGDTVNGVTLTLIVEGFGGNSTATQNYTLHALTSSWGDAGNGTLGSGSGGTGGGGSGMGTQAQSGDATWLDRAYASAGGTTWQTAGGDFSSTVSATTAIPFTGETTPFAVNFTSAQLVTDVNNWISNPQDNFGWIIEGNESSKAAIAMFSTLEGSATPTLSIAYAALPEPNTALLLALSLVSMLAFWRLRA